MSEIFDGYDRQYCELSANLSRKCTSVPALHGEEKKHKLTELKTALDEADSLIHRMDLEARSLPPTQKATLLAKLREYKSVYPPPPPEYYTCLGDLYSVAWMEDTEKENLKKETLEDQYVIVKARTSNHNTYRTGSHVMQYGDIHIDVEELELYLGFDPANENVTKPELPEFLSSKAEILTHVPQREADLLHLRHKYYHAEKGSLRKIRAGRELSRTIVHRKHLDDSVKLIGEMLFGLESGLEKLSAVRPAGSVVVDDWACLKSMVRTYEASCGALTQYGMKHMRAFANICNAGIGTAQMSAAASKACAASPTAGLGIWTPVTSKFSA